MEDGFLELDSELVKDGSRASHEQQQQLKTRKRGVYDKEAKRPREKPTAVIDASLQAELPTLEAEITELEKELAALEAAEAQQSVAPGVHAERTLRLQWRARRLLGQLAPASQEAQAELCKPTLPPPFPPPPPPPPAPHCECRIWIRYAWWVE